MGGESGRRGGEGCPSTLPPPPLCPPSIPPSRSYIGRPQVVPELVPCDPSDATQLWWLPSPLTVSGLVNVALNLSLAVGDSTVYGTVHGNDPQPLLDGGGMGDEGGEKRGRGAIVPPSPPPCSSRQPRTA